MYAEILPLAALEGMAAGLPVVAAATGGLAEVVPSEGLHPPGDAGPSRTACVPSGATLRPGSGRWRSPASGFAPEVVARELGALYDRVAQTPASG